jgi:predicted DsbA family dithiol-disulfide isomerase
VEIEIYSDVVCPWCYVGATRLATALASFAPEVTLRWRAFQLDPGAPRACRPVPAWLRARHGDDRASDFMAHVSAVARADGLVIDLDRAVIANTFDAHRLLWFADQPQAVCFGATATTQPELADSLYRAHLCDGLDVGSHDLLVALAAAVGLAAGRVGRLLASNEGTADVRAEIARAHDLGITSVPTFVVAGSFAITGAHPVATLRTIIDEALRREGMAPVLRRLVPGQRTTHTREDDSRVA